MLDRDRENLFPYLTTLKKSAQAQSCQILDANPGSPTDWLWWS